MGSTLFRDLQARSNVLSALWMLQTRAFGSLNCIDPLDSVPNYYIFIFHILLPVRLNIGYGDIILPPRTFAEPITAEVLHSNSKCKMKWKQLNR